MSRDEFDHIWNTMLIYIKLCTHIGQIDGEVAEIPRMLQLSQLILGIVYRYMLMNNPIDFYLAHALSDKSLPHVTFNPPVQ
jgi:hypothetical protein